MNIPPPQSRSELLARAQALAGRSIKELAEQANTCLPNNLTHAKGFVGQLLEKLLGADAKSKAEPDFTRLSIELKSIPLRANLRAQESTYVCTLPLQPKAPLNWRTSVVYQKLQTVLWVPVEAEKNLALPARCIGMPLLWSPSATEEQLLENDWEEIMELVLYGDLERLDARWGEALHVRPKAMNSKSLLWSINSQGSPVQTLPRGFYLRSNFTNYLLQTYWL